MRSNHAQLLALTTFMTVFCAIPSASFAQSDAQLRRQNEELTQRVREMSDELRIAKQRIAELEKTVASLEAQLEEAKKGRRVDEPTPETPVSIDESTPDASPRALLWHLQEDYKSTLGDLDLGATGDRTRGVYLRSLDRWIKSVNRLNRMQIEWRVKIVDAQRSSRGVQLQLIAIDPETRAELGDPFTGVLTNTNVIRRLEAFERNGVVDNLVMRGVLEPNVRLNERREEIGTFDNPPFIGPFAEFGFGASIDTVLAPAEAAEDKSRQRAGG